MDNREIFCSTAFQIIKIVVRTLFLPSAMNSRYTPPIHAHSRRKMYQDRGASGEIAWKSNLDAFPKLINMILAKPVVSSNGLAINIGAIKTFGSEIMLLNTGVGLLDRNTGQLVSFAEGDEASTGTLSVTFGSISALL